ncbi:hypothetical protein ACWEV3_00625 [Saccharopolyspora sp. NPDC003752]
MDLHQLPARGPAGLLLDDIRIEEVGRDSAPRTGFLVRPASGAGSS